MADIETGLIRHFKFDEGSGTTAIDSSIYEVDGTLVNAPEYRTGEGETGTHSLLGDGTNQYCNVGLIAATAGASAISLTCRLYLVPGDFDMIATIHVDADNRIELELGGSGIGASTALLAVVSNGGSAYGYTASGLLSSLKWCDIAMVFDGMLTGNANRLKVYVDGIQRPLTFSGTIPATLPSTAAESWLIGWRDDFPAGFSINGRVDDFRIYARALSADDISLLVSTRRPEGYPVAQDRCTDTSATALTSHAGDFNCYWTEHPSYTSGDMIISDANRIRSNSANGSVFLISGTPLTANYLIRADLYVFSNVASSFAGILVRGSAVADTRYQFLYNVANTRWELVKIVAGSGTTITSYSETLVAGRTYQIQLEVFGSAITCLIDGVPRIMWQDDDIALTGQAGICSLANTSNSTGFHLDNIWVQDIIPRTLVLCVGDSRTHSTYQVASAAASYPAIAQRTLPLDIRNLGFDGKQMSEVVADRAALVDPLEGTEQTIVCYFAGSNDIWAHGATAAQLISNTETFGRAVIASGKKVIVATDTHRGDGGSAAANQAIQDEVNDYIRAHWRDFAHAMVDLAGDARISDPDDVRTRQSDKVHYNEYGNACIADNFIPAIEAVAANQAAVAQLNALVASAFTFSPYLIDEDHTWSFQNSQQMIAPMYVSENLLFDGAVRMDFTAPMPADACIATVGAVTIAAVSGESAPLVGTAYKTPDCKKIDIPIDAATATASTYLLSATITTTDGQTIKRKGRLVLS